MVSVRRGGAAVSCRGVGLAGEGWELAALSSPTGRAEQGDAGRCASFGVQVVAAHRGDTGKQRGFSCTPCAWWGLAPAARSHPCGTVHAPSHLFPSPMEVGTSHRGVGTWGLSSWRPWPRLRVAGAVPACPRLQQGLQRLAGAGDVVP